MAKVESSLKNMIISLVMIGFVAAALLATAYDLTKEPIAQASLQKRINAIKEVVPEFNNNPYEDRIKIPTGEGTDSLYVFPARMNDELVGYAVSSFTRMGWTAGANFFVMVGFKADGSIHNIAVLEHKETPGLGTKMYEPRFADQFLGMHPGKLGRNYFKIRNDGGQIDGITAATITARAFVDAVQRAFDTLEKGGLI